MRKDDREEDWDLEPQMTPRVFWLVFFFCFLLLLLLVGLELKLRLDLCPVEFAERDESKLIVFGGKVC